MPYIQESRRYHFDKQIGHIVESLGQDFLGGEPIEGGDFDENQAKGDLNYVICTIVNSFVNLHGEKYHRYNDLIGVLECSKAEIYRRLISNYEDKAMIKSGEVFKL